LGPCQDKRDGTEVGIHGGLVGAVSGDDDGIGAPDGKTGGDDGVARMGQLICIYPYVPFTVYWPNLRKKSTLRQRDVHLQKQQE
jgi:hypothetical protein